MNIFNEEISRAVDDKSKIIAIARLCRNLERVHYFYDFNGRTHSVLLMNALLVREGLSPCLSDSSLVWKQSINELYHLIIQWQEEAKQIISARQHAT